MNEINILKFELLEYMLIKRSIHYVLINQIALF